MNQDEFKKIMLRAIGNEIEAYTFYRTVSDRAKDKKLKDLFDELAKDEAKHKLTLEGFLTKAPEKLHFSQSTDYKVGDAASYARFDGGPQTSRWPGNRHQKRTRSHADVYPISKNQHGRRAKKHLYRTRVHGAGTQEQT